MATMGGWKTWAGGLSLIFSGIALALKEITDGTFEFQEAIMLIGNGLAVIGIGHKIEKTRG